MSSLIMEALAFDSGRAAGVNVEAAGDSAGYVESALVSLASARRENPGCEVALFCNEPLDDRHAEVADRIGIEVRTVPFDYYVFDPGLTWHLAYYKLCALKHVLGDGYDSVCLMDTDTWSRGPVSDLIGHRGRPSENPPCPHGDATCGGIVHDVRQHIVASRKPGRVFGQSGGGLHGRA